MGMQGFHFDIQARTMNDAYTDLCSYLQKEGVFITPYQKPIIHPFVLPDGTVSYYFAKPDMTPEVLKRLFLNEFQ